MSQSGNKFIKSMSLINLLPQKIQEEFNRKSLLKVISGLSNFELKSVNKISEAAFLGGADLIDIACNPKLVESAIQVSSLPICVSSVEPKLFIDSVKAGASLIEIGNYDSFYEKGLTFSEEKILNLTKETKDILPNTPLSVTVPHTMPIDKQVDLAIKLVFLGADIIQTEGGKGSNPYNAGIQGVLEKAVPTLAATYAIFKEFEKQSINTPIMSASGLSEVTCPLAVSCGASAVGVGSVVNKLDDLISMIAVVRGLKESLKNSMIKEKIS
tara:strand:- start:176 stop:985 length:810 start_codon:yes stop_codon:yes gene_type:complete